MPQSVFAPPAAEPVIRGNRGTVYAVSSFGVDFTTFGPEFSPAAHFNSDRYRDLDFKHQFPLCKRHDGKIYDFQGRVIRQGSYALTQPFIGSSMPASYVPLDQRRPSSPYRLARLIVRSFTNLVFGEGRFPRFVSDDQDTQDFVEELAKQAAAAVAFVKARNIGGSVGTCGVSWRFWNGLPRLRVHNGKHLIPHTWVDREEFEVEHVTEVTQTSRIEYDPEEKKHVRKFFWKRRDWTPNADLQFCEAEVTGPNDPIEWIIDEDASYFHDDGFAHFVWLRNSSDDDEGIEDDGSCDFEGQLEELDDIDILKSVLSSGTVRNLDPTLILAMSKAQEAKAAAGGVDKGSGHAINVGEGGTASYLEISGASTEAGLNLLKEKRAMLLESAQCVVPSTAELTSAGTSAVAQKMLFAPMLSATGIHRNEYGKGLVRVFDQMLKSARRRYPNTNEEGETEYPVEVTEEGDEQPVDFFLDLQPKVVSENEVDENGKPTGKIVKRLKTLHPGKGRIAVKWPEYFPATSQDMQTKAGAITAAAGGKPTLSQQTGVEIMAEEVGIEPSREWERVTVEARAAATLEAGMFGGMGGSVAHRDELPEGAEPLTMGGVNATGGKGAAQIASAKIKMAAESRGVTWTANELRAADGKEPIQETITKPDGSVMSAGDLPMPAFEAYMAALGEKLGGGGSVEKPKPQEGPVPPEG